MKIPHAPRRGVTLLELLVVIFIIMLLAAAATRVMRPALENTQVREAGRILSAMLGSARNEAMLSRRSTGIMFMPLKTNVSASMQLVYVQVPPPYAGDSLASRIRFKAAPAAVAGNTAARVYTVEFPQSDAWTSQVAAFNTVKFNHQGHEFLVLAIDTTDANNPKLTLECKSISRWPEATAAGDPGMTFQFTRGPKELSRKPVTLPTGAVVDLLASGIGDEQFIPNAAQNIGVMFSPSGQLEKVYYFNASQGVTVTQNVHFLLGRPGGAGNSDNIRDLRSVWVTIAGQSGLVGTDKNAQVWGPGTDTKWGQAGTDDDNNGVQDDISESGRTGSDDVINTAADVGSAADRRSARRYAASSKSLGG